MRRQRGEEREMSATEIAFLLAFGFIGATICGALGYLVAADRHWLGFALGFLLGPIGVLVAVLLPRDRDPKSDRAKSRAKRESTFYQRGADQWLDECR